MPPHSRNQRRRQPVRTQQRRAAERPSSEGLTTERFPGIRVGNRRLVAEPVDYSRDYAYVRSDLTWIAIWSVLLFAGMFVIFFVI